jgi:hypothetical protein
MAFSTAKINELENFYGFSLPEKYKLMMLLIGDKIMDISFKNPRNKKNNGGVFNSSIYEIQDYMRSWITECEISELYDPCIFFITAFLRYDDCVNVAYFIKVNETDNFSVYSFKSDNILDIDSIDIFSCDIEEWLHKINPFLYIELQARKLIYGIT